jgi:hypothetical protein
MEELKPINIAHRIKSLDLVSYSIAERQFNFDIDPNKITFEIRVVVNIIDAEKLISIANPIEIFSDETKRETLGSLQVKGEFIIENIEEIKIGNGLPVAVVATFVGVVISSARGMLRVLSKGTSFEKAIIPLINPMAILATIKEDSIVAASK